MESCGEVRLVLIYPLQDVQMIILYSSRVLQCGADGYSDVFYSRRRDGT